jgi:uridine kinase
MKLKQTNKKTTQRINETRSWFFKRENKIDKLLANLTKRKEKTQIKRDITTNTYKIQRIIREYFENLHPNNLENLEEMEKFLDAFEQPKLNQEAISPLN